MILDAVMLRVALILVALDYQYWLYPTLFIGGSVL
jgi:hypothetical protein